MHNGLIQTIWFTRFCLSGLESCRIFRYAPMHPYGKRPICIDMGHSRNTDTCIKYWHENVCFPWAVCQALLRYTVNDNMQTCQGLLQYSLDLQPASLCNLPHLSMVTASLHFIPQLFLFIRFHFISFSGIMLLTAFSYLFLPSKVVNKTKIVITSVTTLLMLKLIFVDRNFRVIFTEPRSWNMTGITFFLVTWSCYLNREFWSFSTYCTSLLLKLTEISVPKTREILVQPTVYGFLVWRVSKDS